MSVLLKSVVMLLVLIVAVTPACAGSTELSRLVVIGACPDPWSSASTPRIPATP